MGHGHSVEPAEAQHVTQATGDCDSHKNRLVKHCHSCYEASFGPVSEAPLVALLLKRRLHGGFIRGILSKDGQKTMDFIVKLATFYNFQLITPEFTTCSPSQMFFLAMFQPCEAVVRLHGLSDVEAIEAR
jgi:hypothetical protein